VTVIGIGMENHGNDLHSSFAANVIPMRPFRHSAATTVSAWLTPIRGRRNDAGFSPATLVVTKDGLAAVGMLPDIETDRNPAADDPTQKAGNAGQSGPTTAVSDNERRRSRAGSKLAMLVALLEREEGATIEEMAATLGWARHTVRGVMSGALAKRFTLQIVSEKAEGRGRTHHIRNGASCPFAAT
jgi:hypothetical protein